MANIFSPNSFVDYESGLVTKEDKAHFANQFMTFVISGFNKTQFSKGFYVRLSMTFGHIAHYNQEGFWETFFDPTTKDGIQVFIEQTLSYPCYGDPRYTYSDAEKALQIWLREYMTTHRLF